MVASGFRHAALAVSTLLLLTGGGLQEAQASPVVYNFEGISDGSAVGNQYAGLSFSQATVLTAGNSLNEFAFPPHSGSGVAFDDGGAISISFASPVFSVGGYFTYGAALTFSAYDSSNTLLGTVSSAFSDNTFGGGGNAGSSPNEYLSFGNASGQIARVVISGGANGSSFVLDDLTVDAANSVPEGNSAVLALLALAAASVVMRRQRGR